MAEWLGWLLSYFPLWLIIPVILLIIIIAVEIQLVQTGESLIDIWR